MIPQGIVCWCLYRYVSAGDMPEYDPNEVLGFWCARCPIGALCNSYGTHIENVTAEDGYFMGIDGSL